VTSDALSKWKELGIQLGFTNVQLEAIIRDCNSDAVKCEEILKSWWYRQRDNKEAIAKQLIAAVENIGLESYADELKGEYSGQFGLNK